MSTKSIPLATLATVTGGRLRTPADRRVEAWNKVHQTGDQKLSDEFMRRDFNGDWLFPKPIFTR